MFLCHCYKYQRDAISMPVPAGLEARPCHFLTLLLAHLDAFHPAFWVLQPVHRYGECCQGLAWVILCLDWLLPKRQVLHTACPGTLSLS